MFIDAWVPKTASPVRAAFIETLLQNAAKNPKLTPMVRFVTAPIVAQIARIL